MSETVPPASATSRVPAPVWSAEPENNTYAAIRPADDVRRRQRAAEVADVPAVLSDGVVRESRRMFAARAACGARLNDDRLGSARWCSAHAASSWPTAHAPWPRSATRISPTDASPDDGEADLIVLHQRQVDAVQGDPGREVAGAADGIEEPVRGPDRPELRRRAPRPRPDAAMHPRRCRRIASSTAMSVAVTRSRPPLEVISSAPTRLRARSSPRRTAAMAISVAG